jgi:hypothetical protein
MATLCFDFPESVIGSTDLQATAKMRYDFPS